MPPNPGANVESLSCVRLFATPWTVAHQAPLSMEFFRQEHWCRFPFPNPEILHIPSSKSAKAMLAQ